MFQRRDAWTAPRKSRFIESIVLGLPIPQLVLAEAKDEKGSFLVIDGKQRLLSLQQFAGIGLQEGSAPLVLTDLKFRSELNGKSYEDLKNDSRLRNHLNEFQNQPIRTVVVKNWQKEDVLYLIFHRLNSETLPLSPQELRQALHPGPFLRFAAEYTTTVGGIHRALGIDSPDFRMRDVELFVRYFAFQYDIGKYSGNLKQFLDDECARRNERWQTEGNRIREKAGEMEAAISATFEIFGQHAFRKWDGSDYETRFNRAVLTSWFFIFQTKISGRKRWPRKQGCGRRMSPCRKTARSSSPLRAPPKASSRPRQGFASGDGSSPKLYEFRSRPRYKYTLSQDVNLETAAAAYQKTRHYREAHAAGFFLPDG